jgi:hypothetical protein
MTVMPDRSIWGLVVLFFCTLSAACNQGSGSPAEVGSYDSVASLHEAAVEAPGFSCKSTRLGAERLGDFALDNLRSRFPGLQDFGACLVGSGKYYIVFDDREHLDEFIDSQLWVDLERIFEPVRNGQTFSGAAGKNWLITDLDPGDKFLDAMEAEEVQSQPARGSSPVD